MLFCLLSTLVGPPKISVVIYSWSV